jgi:hypothetical protein
VKHARGMLELPMSFYLEHHLGSPVIDESIILKLILKNSNIIL